MQEIYDAFAQHIGHSLTVHSVNADAEPKVNTLLDLWCDTCGRSVKLVQDLAVVRVNEIAVFRTLTPNGMVSEYYYAVQDGMESEDDGVFDISDLVYPAPLPDMATATGLQTILRYAIETGQITDNGIDCDVIDQMNAAKEQRLQSAQ